MILATSRMSAASKFRLASSAPGGAWGWGGRMLTNRSFPTNVFMSGKEDGGGVGAVAGAAGAWETGVTGSPLRRLGGNIEHAPTSKGITTAMRGLFEGIISLTGSAAVALAGHGAALEALPGSWVSSARASRLSRRAPS